MNKWLRGYVHVPAKWQYKFKPKSWTHVMLFPESPIYFFKHEHNQWFAFTDKWVLFNPAHRYMENGLLIGRHFKRDDELS